MMRITHQAWPNNSVVGLKRKKNQKCLQVSHGRNMPKTYTCIHRKQLGLMQLGRVFSLILFQGTVCTLEAPRIKGPWVRTRLRVV